jgi:ankyrin repeat protein
VAVGHALAAKADVNARAKADGRTPLMLAAAFGDPAITSALLDAGADPNLADIAGLTPLHVAVYGERWEVLDALVRHGANPNAVDRRKTTPLTLAVGFDRTTDARGVRSLLQSGGDPDFAPPGSNSARDRVQVLAEGKGTQFPAYLAVMAQERK